MSSNQHIRHFTAIALGMIATSGFWEGAKGLSLPHFLTDLALQPALGGAIFAAGALGFTLTALTFGTLSHRLGLKRLVLTGCLLGLAALAAFLTGRHPVVLYGASMFLGTGISLVEMSTSLPISLLYGDRQGGMLNLLHGLFGVGTLVGALWGGLWFRAGAPWQVAMGLIGLPVAVWTVWFTALPALPLPRSTGREGGYGPLLRDPLVWIAALALAAAVVAESGMGLWLPSYLQRSKGLSEGASAFYTTAFFIGFTACRLAGGWLIDRVGPVRSVVLLGLIGGAGLMALILLPGPWAWLSALAGAGVAMGFATAVALVAARYPDRMGRVYSLMYSSGGVSAILAGPAMGWIAQRVSLSAVMGVPLGAYAALVGLMLLYGWGSRTWGGSAAAG